VNFFLNTVYYVVQNFTVTENQELSSVICFRIFFQHPVHKGKSESSYVVFELQDASEVANIILE